MTRKRLAAAGALLAMAALGIGVSVAVAASSRSSDATRTSFTHCTTAACAKKSAKLTTTSCSNPTSAGCTQTTAPTTTTATTTTRHRTGAFAPDTLRGAPEVSGVILDAATHQFKQVVFDRGRVTAVTASSVTIRQRQGGLVWRTQDFAVPGNAVVMVGKKPTGSLSSIKVGDVVRIESSGPVGGSVAVVKINAFARNASVPMPTTN